MLSGWTKSCNIRLYNSTSTLTDYQVKFVIHRSSGTNSGDNIYLGTDCQADYGDIRFTSTSDVEYSYWIESYDASSAIIWVKIPSVTGSAYTNLVLQYGNSVATTTSNGSNTFVFFDDFNTLDTTTKWDTVARAGCTATSNGTQLDIYCTNTYSGASIISKSTIDTSKNYVIESQVKRTSDANTGEIGAHIGVTNKVTYDSTYYGFYSPWIAIQPTYRYTALSTILVATYDSAVVNGPVSYANPINVTVRCSATIDFTNRICKGTFAYSGNTYTLTTAQGTTPTGSLYWQVGSGNYNVTNHTYFDFIAVRIYSPAEPTKYYPRALSEWAYRKSHTITHPTGGLTNYQVKIRVYRTTGTDSGDTVYVGDKCLADFGDIRFTNNTGTELDYWMETNAGTYADFWVEIDSIGTSTTIYVYYGNSSATTTSNGDTTFIFFDDFSGDLSKWTAANYAGGTGSATISDGICTITRSSGNGYQIYTTSTYGTNTAIRTKCNLPGTSLYSYFGYHNSSNYGSIIYTHYPTTNQFCIINRNPYPTEVSTAVGTGYTGYKLFDIIRNGTTSTIFKSNDASIGTLTTNIPSISVPIEFTAQGQTIYVDWILVRQYNTNDVSHTAWGAEQDLSATSFTIRITPTSGTDPLSVTYNCIIPEGTLDNFTLSYGDGQEYTAATQSSFATTHVYNEPGTYTVWGEGYTEFATHVYYEIPYGVNVSAPSVVASFTYDQNYNTITFTDLSTGNINEWYWDFGDGNHSYEQNPVHVYKSPAIYPITLYISNQYQYSNESSEVTISEILTPPSAYFTPARLDVVNPTLPYSVTFTNLSTPDFGCTYDWTVDGETVSTSSDPTISFATHGVYDVGLTVTNSLGSSTRTYTDAIRLTRKSRTMNEVVGGADTFATFGVQVFMEYATGSDLPIVYATILPEGVYFVQREIPDVPGIDEWGVRHLYSTINEWGIKIFNTINSWGHKILHNSSSVDRTPLKCIDVEIFEETINISDDHTFDEDPS